EVKGPALVGGGVAGVEPGEKRRRRRRRHVPRQLRIVAPPEIAGLRFDLTDEFTLGRAAGCQVTLDDTYASQIHARVFRRDDQYYIEDLGSTNGTWLDRAKVTGPMEL